MVNPMDDFERARLWQEAHETLARSSEFLADFQRRREERIAAGEIPIVAEGWLPTPGPEPAPLQRAPDIDAELVRAIVDGTIARVRNEITEAVGQVVARERAATKAMIGEVRREVTELVARAAELHPTRVLEKLDRISAQLEISDARLVQLAQFDRSADVVLQH
jgi:hypothetical protein